MRGCWSDSDSACSWRARSALAGSSLKVRLLPAVGGPLEVLPYGSKRVLVSTSKGITRLLRSDAIDRSFGRNGWVDVANPIAVRVQPSGRILVLSSRNYEPTLTRLLPSGDVDRSFGDGGIVPVDFGYRFNQAWAMTVAEGGVVIAGTGGEAVDKRTGETFGPSTLERFKANGAVDSGFGDGGRRKVVLTSPSGEAYNPELTSLQTLPGGRLLGANDYNGSIVKLDSDGSTVRSFGDQGLVVRSSLDEQGPGARFFANQPPIVLPNGGFLLVGSVTESTGSGLRYTVATSRYRPGGKLDRSYGKSGYAVMPFSGSTFVGGAALRPDGDLLLAIGRQRPPGKNSRLGVLVLRPSGKLDRSIVGGGERIIGFGGWTISDAAVARPGGEALVFGGVRATDKHPSGELVARVSLRHRQHHRRHRHHSR